MMMHSMDRGREGVHCFNANHGLWICRWVSVLFLFPCLCDVRLYSFVHWMMVVVGLGLLFQLRMIVMMHSRRRMMVVVLVPVDDDEDIR